MPARFESGVYPPDVAAMMTKALDGAWVRGQAMSKDAELTRLLLAGAIIDLVEEGLSDCDGIIERAVKIFEAAANVTKHVVPRSREDRSSC
jgi:hypothetical protein